MRSTTKSISASKATRSAARSCAQNRLEPRRAVLDVTHAEQIFQPLVLERIAFHVEEHVARSPARAAGRSRAGAQRSRLEQLDAGPRRFGGAQAATPPAIASLIHRRSLQLAATRAPAARRASAASVRSRRRPAAARSGPR